MPNPNADRDVLSVDNSTRLFQIVDAFEEAWQGGELPAIDDYLPAEGPLRRRALMKLIHIDLEYRLRAGEKTNIETYLGRFPEIASDFSLDPDVLAAKADGVRSPAYAAGGLVDKADDLAEVPYESRIGGTPFEQVVSLCDAFKRNWRANNHSIDDYLKRVAEESQPTLLRNLLVIDIEKRRSARETPQVEEYLERYPPFGTLIRDVFLDLATLSSIHSETPNPPDSCVTASHLSPVGPKVATIKIPAGNRLGDYRLLGELGRGGMGVVYEAVHLQRGNRVALKTLPHVDGQALHLFKREFRSLADVNHPNLVGMHRLEADGGQWFFTMELIEGVTFLKYVRPNDVLDEARLRSALSQLVRGVMALHGRHIIHRDLKPTNVMVTRDGNVIVLDFGLVLELDHVSRSTDKIAGTPAYMAPEQAAGIPVTPASDWYGLGVMLYEALAGKLPFSGPMVRVLQDKQKIDPPALPTDTGLPADLAALCMRLLARDPQHRPDAFEIVKALASSAQSAETAEAPSGQLLVGRDQQLTALKNTVGAFERQCEPLTVFISGRSGEGKSTLAEHFLTPLRAAKRLAVMSGRCYDRESVPFKALDALIDALAGFLRLLPETDAALLMPDDIGLLARVFPVLQRVEVVARASDNRLAGLDDQQVRQRAFRALRSLLIRISRRSPIIWFVDDLQWGDADSAEALFEVLRPPEAPAVLFLGAYRSDETEGSAFLKMWKELQRKHDVRFADSEVKVAPLTLEECTELVIGAVGMDNDRIRQRAAEFAEETRGNPFLLIELIGCFDSETDSFEPMPLHEVLARKLERLPAEAAQLLDVVAVAGHGMLLEEASRAAGHEVLPVATLARMCKERIVRLIGADECPQVDTYHDRVRETILGRMDEARCKSLHLKLAEIIEKDCGSSGERLEELATGEMQQTAKPIARVYDLSYHFDAAGEKSKAWRYAVLAAEQARRQSALEVAVQQYAIASRNLEDTSNAVRFRIAEGSAEALMLLGRYEDANQQLEGAVDLVDDAERKARIEALQGEIAIKQGALNKSIAYYEQGLRRLGHWVPQTTFGFVYGVLRETVIQCVHCLLPGRLHRKPPGSQLDLSNRLFFRLSHPLTFQNTLKMLWAHLTGLNRAELPPPSPRMAYIYAFHNCIMSMLGWHGRGDHYGDRAIKLAREFDDIWGQGEGHNYKGIGLYASARYEEGLARMTDAIAAYEKAGDPWEGHLAHFHKGCCHFGLGDFAEAIAEARWTFASSARLGDSRVLCASYLWARATRGNFPFEELKTCYPCRPDDVMSTVHGIMAEGHWHTFHGRTKEALETFERAGELVRKSFCVNSHMIVALPELAGARRHADALQHTDPQQCDQLRRRAYRLAKWATRLTWLFPAAYPLALRERSLILAVYGKTKKALKFADKSCAVAEAQKAKYEHTQSLLVRGKLAKELGLPEADEQIRTAEAALDALERPIREAAVPGSQAYGPITP